mgnify:CR=1 FL=1
MCYVMLYYSIGYWPCMLKSTLNGVFCDWKLPSLWKNAKHRGPSIISSYTVSNRFIAYVDIVNTLFMYFKLLQSKKNQEKIDVFLIIVKTCVSAVEWRFKYFRKLNRIFHYNSWHFLVTPNISIQNVQRRVLSVYYCFAKTLQLYQVRDCICTIHASQA